MSFMDRFEETLEKGIEASKELFSKAKDKAKDLSEIGVLKFEIHQLENQVEKILGQLGSKMYKLMAEENKDTVKADDPEIKDLVNEISDVKQRIESKEEQLREIKAKK